VIDAQLAAAPDSRPLRLLKGAIQSEAADIDGAIATFEALYAENTSDLVVANNLASLLATHRADDPAQLERAAAIARRLRGREVPAFQDTYGWIAFLRGELDAALAHLEPAAEGLPEDALVQYHLGRVYEALDRPADARARYTRALELAEGRPIAGLPQFETARARLAGLPTD
jgi:Flp pilus assembly protein TadD